MRIAKEFSDGTALGWDRCVIDMWCVYYRDENGTISAPHDVDYFTELLRIADKYGHQRVYDDFVSLYNSVVSKDPAECHIEVIDMMVSTYPVEDRLSIDKNFTTLWMAMVSNGTT